MTGTRRLKSSKGKIKNTICRRCYLSKKPAFKCAFKNKAKTFSMENWNCATMNALRDITEGRATWNEDQFLAVISIPNEGEFLVLSWYKDRGRTAGAWIVEESRIRKLTLKKAERIIEICTLNKKG